MVPRIRHPVNNYKVSQPKDIEYAFVAYYRNLYESLDLDKD